MPMLKDTVGSNNIYRSEGVTMFRECPAREAGRETSEVDWQGKIWQSSHKIDKRSGWKFYAEEKKKLDVRNAIPK